MTQVDRDDAGTVPVELNPANCPTGDVLHPEWGESPSWFGYIGVGIAVVAMLLGVAAMVGSVMYFVKWAGV
jgi:hypothetical protein